MRNWAQVKYITQLIFGAKHSTQGWNLLLKEKKLLFTKKEDKKKRVWCFMGDREKKNPYSTNRDCKLSKQYRDGYA